MKNKLNEGGFLNVTKIIAFANQKGGVAKTTSAIALAQTLAMEGKRILFLDLDPQENASNTLRVNHMPTLYDLMKARKPDDETLKKSFCQLEDNKNITAIRGDIRLASADMEFVFTGREFIIRDILRRCCEPYDVVIMDTPPNLGILTVNALSAAHTVVIPVSPDGYSLQGFMQLKAYSFQIGTPTSKKLFLFESAIDLLSYYELSANKQNNYLSVSGVYQPNKKDTAYTIPAAVTKFLTQNPHIKTIHICFDNDNAGCKAANALYKQLSPKYEAFIEPPTQGKDYNDQLLYERGLPKTFKTRITKNHNKEDLTK